MALSANTIRLYEAPLPNCSNDVPAAASVIYEGSAVGINTSTGYGRALTAGDHFAGFATAKCDNSAGSAGDKRINVWREGFVRLTISGVALTNVGDPVYATDDGTFTLTQGTGSRIGEVFRYVTTDTAIVHFEQRPYLGGQQYGYFSFPVNLASITGAGDVVTGFTPGFKGFIVDWQFVTTVPVTTGSKAATLNIEVGTTNLTGGTIALTSALCTPLGAVVAQGSAFSAGQAFSASDTISVEAASVTAFSEGAGVLMIRYRRDLF